jgi:hypothetical protein
LHPDDLLLRPPARRDELARIFASGILRLQTQRASQPRQQSPTAAASQPTVKNLSESRSDRLDVPAPTVLSVHTS